MRNALFFCGALAACCVLIHALLPMAEVPEVAAKLRWLQVHRDDYDTVFLGSSHVRRQVSPEVFDRRMQQLGVQTRSYNLGADAMTFPESPYLFDQLLEQRLFPHLKLVVVELNPLRRKIVPESEERTLRAIYWHDFPQTMRICEAILRDPRSSELSAFEIASRLGSHCRMMLSNYSNIGRGVELLRLDRLKERAPAAVPLGEGGAGYFPVRETIPAGDRAAYAVRLEEMRRLGERPVARDPVFEEALGRFTREIERAGARVCFFVAPSLIDCRPALPPGAAAGEPAVLFFDQPDRYPELYSAENRYDPQHLNANGGARFTEILADEIAPLLAAAFSAN